MTGALKMEMEAFRFQPSTPSLVEDGLDRVTFEHTDLDPALRNTEQTGGKDYGTLMVRIGVDGWFDQVLVDLGVTGNLVAVVRAREVLAEIEAAIRATDAWPGRCITTDRDAGRCKDMHGHAREHRWEFSGD